MTGNHLEKPFLLSAFKYHGNSQGKEGEGCDSRAGGVDAFSISFFFSFLTTMVSVDTQVCDLGAYLHMVEPQLLKVFK